MFSLNDICWLCLRFEQDLESLTTADDEDLTFFVKLTSCIPEMDLNEMLVQGMICKECCENINTIYHFREKCLRNKIKLKDYITQSNFFKSVSADVTEPEISVTASSDTNEDTNADSEMHSNDSEDCDMILSAKIKTECDDSDLPDTPYDSLLPVKVELNCEDSYGEGSTENDFIINDEGKNITNEMGPENSYYSLLTTKNSSGKQPQRSTKTIYECEVCKRNFIYISALKTHMRIHTGEKPFECNICSKKFNRSSTLVGHMRIHTGEKPYECNICKKRFNCNSNLTHHLQIHIGEKTFECSICYKKFLRSTELVYHMRTHTGEKPYECQLCGKRFTHSGHLNVHVRTHTGEKTHECNTCYKKFNGSSDLIKHRRVHTGEKPYMCEICTRRFAQIGSLHCHMLTHK